MTPLLFALLLLLATSQAFLLGTTRLARSAQSHHSKSAQRLYCTPEPTPASAPAPAQAAVAKKAEGVELLEIRVGRIVSLNKHPEADNLYVEQVDLGEPELRTIVSGLVEFCTYEQLLHREVLVLCNLKPRALKGITSQGMLLCASDKANGKVDPLTPPTGTLLGELVTIEGYSMLPVEAGNKASKAGAATYC
mmetsp:Transcript_28564/g.61539  ORF Transcript_28564/g.61539 Transcript_28564/m.61539 type:complete len:193 (-) Transcript_28564:610-1188(-)